MAPEKNMRVKLASDMACEAFQVFFYVLQAGRNFLTRFILTRGVANNSKGTVNEYLSAKV